MYRIYRPAAQKRLLLHLLPIALAIMPNLFAQETTAGLQGTVKDPSGAIIPKANAPKQAIEGMEIVAVDRIEQAVVAIR